MFLQERRTIHTLPLVCPSCQNQIAISYEASWDSCYRLQKWTCPACEASNTLTLAGRIANVASR